jgi:hypothetical protein
MMIEIETGGGTMQKAIEKINEMAVREALARDATAEALKVTNDPVAIAGLVVKYGVHCAAVGAFVMALEEIEKEQDEA